MSAILSLYYTIINKKEQHTHSSPSENYIDNMFGKGQEQDKSGTGPTALVTSHWTDYSLSKDWSLAY